MNSNGYFLNPIFSGTDVESNMINEQQSAPDYEKKQIEINSIGMEQIYIENILKLNTGKKAKFYITIPGSDEYQSKVFEGIIEQTGKDHIILSNPNGEWYLILMIYINFVIFDEPINFIKDFK